MQQKLDFRILKKRGNARVGKIVLNGVEVTTPVFMPVGTKATIKGIPYEWLQTDYLGTASPINLLLNNTFHLHLRPGAEAIQKYGGLHRFQNRDKLILTDSGGFQVFSLGLSKQGKPLAKLQDDGVVFKSPYDGSKHFFSPTGVVDMQRMFGTDIMMMLDVCSPVKHISKKEVDRQMQLTHTWAKEQYAYHMGAYTDYRGVLFPIVQGGLHTDLREQSAATLSDFAHDGIAIGGLSVGETVDEMEHILQHTVPHLPEDKPRYLMGLGTPDELRMAVEQGVDMFDCVMPTRLGRHGSAFTAAGTIKLKNASYKDDLSPVEPTCGCYCCKHFTKAYLHHLMKENEMYGAMLLSLHNIAYLHRLMEQIQQEILGSETE